MRVRIERCPCGHEACRSFEFSNAVGGKFLRDDAEAMLDALKRFIEEEPAKPGEAREVQP